MEVNILHIHFEVNPLGQLLVFWTIPKASLKDNAAFEIEVPGYKYDMSTIASIPVPFSSKGIELMIDDVSVDDASYTYEIKKAPYGNKIISFKSTRLLINQELHISYTINQIVNHDGIYFVMVYPFRSPFYCPHRIKVNAKFSYNIRRYKFWERHFSYPQNEKIITSKVFTCQKAGDEITVTGDYTPTSSETLDMHFTATRFPILIRRDKFWFIVFLIFLLLALSPYILVILD